LLKKDIRPTKTPNTPRIVSLRETFCCHKNSTLNYKASYAQNITNTKLAKESRHKLIISQGCSARQAALEDYVNPASMLENDPKIKFPELFSKHATNTDPFVTKT
jgi:hypothetical protein